MSQAFEITPQDVENVLGQNISLISATYRNGRTDEAIAADLFEEIDMAVVEDAALYGDSMDEQTTYAYDAIRLQLVELGVIDMSVEVAAATVDRRG